MSRAQATDLRKLAEQAIALHRSGKARAALPLYRQLLKAQPDSVPFRVLMAEALRLAGEDEEEGRVLEEAARLDPNAAGPQVLLGGRAERKGDRAAAIAHFDKALATEPGNAEAQIRRALVLVSLGRFDDAETAL